MARVLLHDLSKRFGDHVAVDRFSLEIADREFVVLVGPSGCGKTTTLRMIAGFESPTNGSIVIGERDVGRVPTKDRNLAMVFQKYALYPHMNVFRNMAFGLKLRKTPKSEIKRRVEATAEMLGIGHLLQRKPGDLSGGEQQRVALGRAVVREADVYLFDEPLSNLDAKLRGRMRSEIVKLHRQLSATMVYVTHDQVEAMMMGDRIVVMNEGRIQQVGTPLEVYSAPANRFVAEFIGSPPMNVIDGQLTNDADCPALQVGSMKIPIPRERAGRYTELVGQRASIGMRAEDIRLAPPENPQGWLEWPAEVQVTQPLGPEWLVEFASEGAFFTVRCSAAAGVQLSEPQITTYWNLQRCHLFDKNGLAVMGAKALD